jgi:Zn-dependent peptidase ImmA (M78 family)
LGVRKQDEIKASAELVAERFHYLHSRLHPNEVPQLPDNKVVTMKDAEGAAMQLRAAWKLGEDPIESLARVVENYGGIVVAMPFDGVKFDGLSGLVNQTWPLTVVNSSVPDDRRRFNLAHELGHLTMKCPKMSDKERENAAHRFAGALLAPASAVMKELGEHRQRILIEELMALKRKYGLSIQAWLFRARDLGIIDERRFAGLYREMSFRGWRKEEPEPYQGDENPMRLRQMALRALAEGIISEREARKLDPGISIEAKEEQTMSREVPSPRELLRMPRKQRLNILEKSAKQAQRIYAEESELREWSEVGVGDLHE